MRKKILFFKVILTQNRQKLTYAIVDEVTICIVFCIVGEDYVDLICRLCHLFLLIFRSKRTCSQLLQSPLDKSCHMNTVYALPNVFYTSPTKAW